MSVAYHVPVMLSESVHGLNIRRGGVYVDATLGGGGHTRAILDSLTAVGGGHLYAMDCDADAMANVPADDYLTFIHSNFRYLSQWLRYYGVEQIDGLIADLGVSSHHFDDPARGFTLRADAPLDMRMNRGGGVTAAALLATTTEEELATILFTYGELRTARRLAHAIVTARTVKPIATTGELLAIITPLLPREREKKECAKVFQALRIAVNHELKALEELLLSAVRWLSPGGRLVVITYHSLEDRLVKNVIRAGNVSGEIASDLYGQCPVPLRKVTREVVTATAEELQRNPRSRSAKLRIAEKI